MDFSVSAKSLRAQKARLRSRMEWHAQPQAGAKNTIRLDHLPTFARLVNH